MRLNAEDLGATTTDLDTDTDTRPLFSDVMCGRDTEIEVTVMAPTGEVLATDSMTLRSQPDPLVDGPPCK